VRQNIVAWQLLAQARDHTSAVRRGAGSDVAWTPWLGGHASILLPTAVFLEVLPSFRRNLTISHFVNCFNGYDASTEFAFLDAFLQLALGLTRAKQQNRIRITNTCNDRIVVNVELSRYLFLAVIRPAGHDARSVTRAFFTTRHSHAEELDAFHRQVASVQVSTFEGQFIEDSSFRISRSAWSQS
jgi:hypothetical protein